VSSWLIEASGIILFIVKLIIIIEKLIIIDPEEPICEVSPHVEYSVNNPADRNSG